MIGPSGGFWSRMGGIGGGQSPNNQPMQQPSNFNKMRMMGQMGNQMQGAPSVGMGMPIHSPNPMGGDLTAGMPAGNTYGGMNPTGLWHTYGQLSGLGGAAPSDTGVSLRPGGLSNRFGSLQY